MKFIQSFELGIVCLKGANEEVKISLYLRLLYNKGLNHLVVPVSQVKQVYNTY